MRHEARHHLTLDAGDPTRLGRLLVHAPALSLVAIATFPLIPREAQTLHPGCLFRQCTSAPCPFCGISRSTEALYAGDWLAWWQWYPMWSVLVALLLYATVVFWRRRLSAPALMRTREALLMALLITAGWIIKLSGDPAWW